MEIKILWSALAESQLKEIYEYYAFKADSKLAKFIINKIIARVDVLQIYPHSGQKEELLIHYKEEFRYLVESNYKIIYWVKDDNVTIASVFDCRQNPKKMKKIR